MLLPQLGQNLDVEGIWALQLGQMTRATEGALTGAPIV